MKFYTVSEIMPDNVLDATKNVCERKDCCRVFRYGGGTLLGHSAYYDSNNKLHFKDPNRCSYGMTCSMCWRKWKITKNLDTDGGEINIEEVTES